MSNEKTIEETYKRLTPYEHILNRPDTYVGSLEFQKDRLWVFNEEEQKLEQREVNYVPGLFKIFDEIIVNAADNYQRDKNMKYIKVDIDPDKGVIKIRNGGRGVPIEIHKEYNMYVPELIFGQLLTSSNYNDDDKRVTGGRNGYGAKLTNIFSKKFIVETADKKKKKMYKQVFSKNMTEKTKPEITQYSEEDFTCITFEPDLKKFKMDKMDEDIVALFRKRVYDMAGTTPNSVSVYLNGKKIEVKNFSTYMDMFLSAEKEEDEEDPVKIFESPHDRWEVGVSLSESQFQQVSYVNSICTSKGGTHVNYVTEKLVNEIMVEIQKKDKKLTIRPQHIKQHLWVFVNCLIENSTFDSQTKETLTSKKDSFGSSFEFSPGFLKKVVKSGIVERCLRYAKTREDEKALKKLNAGKNKKAGRVLGIEKLEDANFAGKKNSEECTLILTEGDSAKSLAMAGIEVVGRDTYGCFPLRGKMLNVRDAKSKAVANNQEVQHLMTILGLKIGETYTDVKRLRYGSIMIMTDQDVDGSHIKGLIINFIHHFWPSLIKLNGFVQEFITPIIKATKGSNVISFYSLPQYNQWKNEIGSTKGWKIKYYKGLGTSTDKEAQEYFSEIHKNRIEFDYLGGDDDEKIDLAFNKKRAAARKKWIEDHDPNSKPLEMTEKPFSYQKFIDRELIEFSIYDNKRSIPCICDGLKPSERKILFGCFKRNLKDEVKVAQLIGYISEHSAYHHGEQSLGSTIVAMSQNFVGSNNINLLLPIGQFGSRNQGGKDSASARYIFTNLNKVTRHLFNSNDLPLMDYLIEEGQKIEPEWYLPIIPLVLVNGAEGIGTGWSTDIPCFNPHDIVNSIRNKIKVGEFLEIDPWYKGFTGKIERNPSKDKDKGLSYIVSGKYEWSETDPNTIIITEIPLKKWTKDYKNFLEELMGVEFSKDSEKKQKKKDKKAEKEDDETKDKKKKIVIVEDFKQNHTNNRVRFEVTLLPEFVDEYKNNPDKLIKTFKLTSSLSLGNMVLFSSDKKIKKYNSVGEIMEEFYKVRLEYYSLRKAYMLSAIKRELCILENKVRFILAVVNEEIIIRRVKRADLVKELVRQGFETMSKLNKIRMKTQSEKKEEIELIKAEEEGDEEETDGETAVKGAVPPREFDYLLTLPLWSLTYEKVEDLEKQKKQKSEEYEKLKETKETDIWLNDLDDFIQVLDEYEQKEEEDRTTADKLKKKTKGKGKTRRGGGKRKKKENEEEKPEKTARKGKVKVQEEGEKKVNGFDILMSGTKTQKENTKKVIDDEPFMLPLNERLKRKDVNIPFASANQNFHTSNVKRKASDPFDEYLGSKKKKVEEE